VQIRRSQPKSQHIMNMKILIAIFSILFLSACEQRQSVPSEAVKACLDKDWVPSYFTNGIKIEFQCVPKEVVINAAKAQKN